MKILLTAFKNTSSEKLIGYFDEGFAKLILENDKRKSEQQLKNALEKDAYSVVLSFGQRPVMKNKLAIETCAKDGERIICTDFDCDDLKNTLAACGIEAKLSSNAGTSFCNNIYRFGLEYLNTFETQMVFVHMPFEKNISDFDMFAECVKKAVSKTFYI
ncbi:MAG: hypothetical protein IJZ72_03575 [Oscillospiraceae bacterium]|nr:hypothetical protein [Oscillospiraceae bacterium]